MIQKGRILKRRGKKPITRRKRRAAWPALGSFFPSQKVEKGESAKSSGEGTAAGGEGGDSGSV